MSSSPFPSTEALGDLEYIFTDIDDTLTKEGYLLPEAFSAIWKLHDAGYKVIPVTGRPAGWCDCIVRQWPVEAVIGENGAFAMFLDNEKHLELFLHPSVPESSVQEKLDIVRDNVLSQIPLARVAKDQPYRRFDLAIDFAEDPPVLGLETAREIKGICEKHGAVAKISSIHVNAWFGDYDKLRMVLLFAEKQLGITETELRKKALFCGDSPNDEPMFSFFPLSFGMANIERFLSDLSTGPAFITENPFGKGFAEIAGKILSIR